MQVNNLYTLIARDVTTDASDQMNSIIKIIDNFNLEINKDEVKKMSGFELGEKPILFPITYFVATSWFLGERLKKETFLTIKMNIVGPSGDNYGGPSQEHLLPTNIDRININFRVDGLPVTAAGNYKLLTELISKDKKVLAKGEYPFKVAIEDLPNTIG
jgi:hypothetical protein